MKQIKQLLLCMLVLFNLLISTNGSSAWAEGMVTMVDIGSKGCIPCKMMEPILEKLKQDYEGRAVIQFIDIRKERKMADGYRIRAIPTQIFLDAGGKEVIRHVGFMSKEDVVRQLSAMGVPAVAQEQ